MDFCKIENLFNLIFQRYVVTAMHCVFDQLETPSQVFVFFGINKICNANLTAHLIKAKVI